VLPRPLSGGRQARRRSPAAAFDTLVGAAVDRLRAHLPGEIDQVQFGVEETPLLPDDWTGEVPLATHVRADRVRDARVVVYRLPMSQRVRGRADTAGLVLDVLVEEIAELLGHDPDDIDPRLRPA